MITIYNVIVILGMLSTNILYVESYRILGIFPLNAHSHYVMFNALMKGLAKRGHHVDDITHYPVKSAPPSYKVVVNLNGTLNDLSNSFTFDKVKSGELIPFIGGYFGNDVCKLLALDKLQQFLKNLRNRPPYDVIITEAFAANCFMGLGHLLKIPVVAVSSSVEYPWMSYIGNYDNLAVIPSSVLSNFNRNKFWDRLNNVITHYWLAHEFYAYTEVQTDYMRKYISPNIPNIREVEKNVALTIINRHPVIHGVKAVTSSLIEASGLHIEENDEVLDKPLKKWLDDSKHGVVYFCFGSLVLIESFPVETLKEMYKSFAKLAPMRVLMKVVDKSKLPRGLPKNVLTLPWMPQQPILAHKNIRVFITHGGMMGCQEALYYGVPMIGVPLFADQGRNVAAFVEKNMAVKLDYNSISTASLDEALNKVLNDPQYRKNSKYFSEVFKDRPMSAMDTAAFWIEYIIRNGPEVLRSPGLEMPWWQTTLIDVYGFIFLSLTVVLTLIYIIMKLFFNCFFALIKKNSVKKKPKVL